MTALLAEHKRRKTVVERELKRQKDEIESENKGGRE